MKKEFEGTLKHIDTRPYANIFYFGKTVEDIALDSQKIKNLFIPFIDKKVKITIEEIETT